MSPNGIAIPFYEEGERITVEVTAPVSSKRFAKISGNRHSGPGVSDAVDGGNYKCAQSGNGEDAVGVFETDQPSIGGKAGLIASPGMVVPVEAGAAIAAGERVQSDATGRAIPATEASATEASLNLGTGNAKVLYTAVDEGDEGNLISIAYVDPGTRNAALDVTVVGRAITVHLATADTVGHAISSTGDDVRDAVNADADASLLVDAARGAGSDGSGVVVATEATRLTGGQDTGKGNECGVAMTAASGAGVDAEIKLRV